MTITNQDDLEGLRAAGKLAATILHKMLGMAREGMTTEALDAYGAQLMHEAGARSAPQVAVNFPKATCISVNEEVAHGIPGERILYPGDVLNVDVSLELNGYFSDNGATMIMPGGKRDERLERMCRETLEARDQAISMVRHGVKFNIVGRVLEERARRAGFRVVKNLCSHGIGRSLHESPEELLPYYDRLDRRTFQEGMVLTVEPFFSTAASWAEEGENGWALMNSPGGRSAQFEHTLVVRRDGPPEILTIPEGV